MELKAILKKINIKNNDVDTYATVTFDLDTTDLDLNKLAGMKHQNLNLTIEKDDE